MQCQVYFFFREDNLSAIIFIVRVLLYFFETFTRPLDDIHLDGKALSFSSKGERPSFRAMLNISSASGDWTLRDLGILLPFALVSPISKYSGQRIYMSSFTLATPLSPYHSLIRIAFITPCWPGLEVTFAFPFSVSMIAPLVMMLRLT